MKKQFELLATIYKKNIENNIKIQELQKQIDADFVEIKQMLLDLYDHETDILFLVSFNHGINFFAASKTEVSEVRLSYFGNSSRTYVIVNEPKTFEDAVALLSNYPDPTNCEMRRLMEFDYFHDTNKRYDRIDWITEEIAARRFLYEITRDDYLKAVNVVSDFYKSEAGGRA